MKNKKKVSQREPHNTTGDARANNLTDELNSLLSLTEAPVQTQCSDQSSSSQRHIHTGTLIYVEMHQVYTNETRESYISVNWRVEDLLYTMFLLTTLCSTGRRSYNMTLLNLW